MLARTQWEQPTWKFQAMHQHDSLPTVKIIPYSSSSLANRSYWLGFPDNFPIQPKSLVVPKVNLNTLFNKPT